MSVRPTLLVLLALPLAALGFAQSLPATPVSSDFSHVLASVNLQPGQSASITVPDAYFKGAAPGDMTIYIPVGTFKDPVTFQVLAASNSHWDGMAKSGQKVVANFAYRVYDRKTHQVVGKFPSAVQYTVADTMVDKHSVYWAVKPGATPRLINANSASTIQGDVLSHPTPTAAVGWIITTPTADLAMKGSGSGSSMSGSQSSTAGSSSGGGSGGM
ncbi:MAG TPA: hypothetical protein VKB31_05965 [Trueperaceae bacterium]|nr:hypothetical protein [Trueperaceae bacterium]